MRSFLPAFASALAAVFLAFAPVAAARTHKLKAGETVESIADNVYGSPQYALAVLKHNKIADAKAVKAGQTLKIPDLKEMVYEAGVTKLYDSELEDVMKARYAYMKVRHDLVKAMQLAGSARKMKVPEKIRAELKDAAKKLSEAGDSLAKKGKFADSPSRLKQRLQECARNLEKLAGGSTDKKLEESIHRLLAQAFVRAIMWGRNEDGE